MNCPVCKDAVLVMADKQGIEIDYCPRCRGVWLDRGELDKLIERSVQSEETAAPPKPSQDDYSSRKRRDDDDDDDYRYHKKKKKRGLLGDLFDFD